MLIECKVLKENPIFGHVKGETVLISEQTADTFPKHYKKPKATKAEPKAKELEVKE